MIKLVRHFSNFSEYALKSSLFVRYAHNIVHPNSLSANFPKLNIISNLKKCPPQRYAEVSGSYGE